MIKFKKGMKKVMVALVIVAMVIGAVPLSNVFAGSSGGNYLPAAAKLVDVTYKFKSETAGKTIPAEVEKLKPKNEAIYEGGTARPTDPTAKTYKAADGTWNFKGWDKDSVKAGTEEIVFTGSWEFVPDNTKKYTVYYTFFAEGTKHHLPKGVTELLPVPNRIEVPDGTTVKPPTISKTKVKDEANDGTWTFTGWGTDQMTVKGKDVAFEGAWTFKANTYKALHKFESVTKGKRLPNEILKRLPSDKNHLVDKEVVDPKDFDTRDYNDGNGVWKFLGWTPNQATVNRGNVYFVGKWEYKENAAPKPKMFNIVHKFVSGTNGVELTDEIKGMLPANKSIEDGKTATPLDFSKKTVKTKNGTWTFKGWDAADKKVNGADVTFTGVWEFTETKKPENKPENKPNEPGQKPESGKDKDGKKPEIKTPDTKKPESKKPPKTADNSGIGVVLAALAISGTGIFGFVSRKRKNK